jgi:hypothetical protein
MNIPQAHCLENGNHYFIITFDTNKIFRGRFDNWDDREDIVVSFYYTYSKIPGRKYKNLDYFNHNYFKCYKNLHYFKHNYFKCNKKYKFTEFDYYYDIEPFKYEIKRMAEKARQQMEQRALDKILKRLVNEEFQW